jgi:hypothetical protein
MTGGQHMVRFITLAAIVAVVFGGAAAAQDRSRAPAGDGAQTSTPPLNDTQGATGNGNGNGGMDSSYPAFGDENANPENAIKRGDIDENSVQSLLQSKGYADVRDLKRQGDTFTATAYKNNQVVRVNVDARSGKITDMKLQ